MNSFNNSDDRLEGFKLMKKGDYSKAISEFEKVMSKSTKVDVKFEAKINIGICLYELQKEPEARECLMDSLNQEGDLYYTGLAHFYLKNYLKSILYFCLSNNRLKYIKIGQSYLEFSDLLDRLVQYKKQDESKKTDLYESILDELKVKDLSLDLLVSENESIDPAYGCKANYLNLLKSIKGIISELESKRFDSFDKSSEDLILRTHRLGI